MKPKQVSIYLINLYQKYLRPHMPACCRYTPSCSEFARLAIEKYGFIKGVWKGLSRILRCHPLAKRSGYDPLI